MQCGVDLPATRRKFCSDKCTSEHWRVHNMGRQRELQRDHYRTEKFAETRGAWLDENADRLKEYRRQYYLKNKERIKEQARNWARDNGDQKRAIKRKYNHSEHGYKKVYEGVRRRLARKAASPDGSFTRDEWTDLAAQYDFTCMCCRRQFDLKRGGLEPDHIVPLAAGGSDAITNIQPLCRNCNAQKGDRVVDYRPERYANRLGATVLIQRVTAIPAEPETDGGAGG